MHFKRIRSKVLCERHALFTRRTEVIYQLVRSDLTITIEYERNTYAVRRNLELRTREERLLAMTEEREHAKRWRRGMFSVVVNGQTLYGPHFTDNLHLMMRMIERNPHKFLREYHVTRERYIQRKHRGAAMLESYMTRPVFPSVEEILADMQTYEFGEPNSRESGAEMLHARYHNKPAHLDELIKTLRNYGRHG